MDQKIALGVRIDLAIKLSNLAKGTVAEKLNISPNSLTNYLKGERIPNVFWLSNFAKLCNVDLVWLMTGEDKEAENENIVEEHHKKEVNKKMANYTSDKELTSSELSIINMIRLTNSHTIINKLLEGRLQTQQAIKELNSEDLDTPKDSPEAT